MIDSKTDLKNKGGFIIIQSIVFGGIAIVIISALVAWAGTNIKSARNSVTREKAIQIAEAGIDYYRWHLAHSPQDFQDGTGQPGPYVHDFYDKDCNTTPTPAGCTPIGTFTLTITPPPLGSTIVTIESVGVAVEDPAVSRKIRARLAIPSFAKWAFVSSSDMRFGEGTEVFGPIHSNGGIRFDGLAHNLVTSARSTYDDPDHDEFGSEKLEYGVHTHIKPPPLTGSYTTYVSAEMPLPATPSSRPDVFAAGRQVSVPNVDFVGITTDLAQIKTDAQANGRYFADSGKIGYKIVLNTNDTFDIQKVTSLVSPPNNCTNSANQTGWSTWSVKNTLSVQNYAFPANGLIFVEDDIWVEGTIDTARLTIVSGKFPDNPATRTSITVNNDLKYTNYDGQDIISLIAQGDINVGLKSEDDLGIDAALIAQNGRVGRYYYGSNCGLEYIRNRITLYGMIGTYGRYGFAYTNGTGYQDRIINYDPNLLYSPPPSFPLTSDQYSIVSWEEF